MNNKYKILSCFFIIIFSLVNPPQSESNSDLGDSVVKIFVTRNGIDFYRPWQSKGINSTGGSGFVVDGNKIVTNAHVVLDHTFVQVKKASSSRKYKAKVLVIGHDCDLALLEVEDKSFFDDVNPLKFGDLPKVQEQVTVLGFPQGGDKISLTKGVVSRIEMTAYSQSARQLLAVQIDAAINPGNSGGPVIKDGKVVGVAMQVLKSSQNIGYMIPVPVVDHFFKDVADGEYNGFPILGIDYQSTENAALRKYYGIEDNTGGVLVTHVLPYSPADGFLKENDVILSINDTDIAEDGTFLFRDNERLNLPYLITQHQIGEEIEFDIVRKKKKKKISFKLKPFHPKVPYPNHYLQPPYYIYGGLVFTVLSTDLLKSWGGNWWEKAPLEFTYHIAGAGRLNLDKKKNIVVLLNVIPDEINLGYLDSSNDVISSVNGKTFKSFNEFIDLIENNTKDYVILETMRNAKIILSTEEVKKGSVDILQRNRIPLNASQGAAVEQPDSLK